MKNLNEKKSYQFIYRYSIMNMNLPIQLGDCRFLSGDYIHYKWDCNKTLIFSLKGHVYMNLSFSEYKSIVDFAPNLIWRSGTDAKCNYFNETWLKFTGKKLEEEVGDGWADGVHADDLEVCVKTYLNAFAKQEPFEMEYRLKRHDGEWRWINDRGVPFYDEEKKFAGFIGSCIDVTENIEGKEYADMAKHDQLTGLNSRNYLEYLLDSEFQKAKQEQTNFVLMVMDIDRFKYFNDHYGHGFGDKVLIHVAQKILENIRKTDICGRYGGDEFLVILPKTEIDEAKRIAKRILEAIAQISIGATSVEISLSIGIVSKCHEIGVGEIIEKADKAMYCAKQSGGNRFNVY